MDVIHGNRIVSPGDTSGTGFYRWDVSEWVVGYLVGSEWDSGNIAYTNNSTTYPSSYAGTYFTTGPDASRFEAAIAPVSYTHLECLMKQSILKFLSAPPEIRPELRQDAFLKNRRSLFLICIMIFFMELFNIARVLFWSRSGLDSVNNRIYFGPVSYTHLDVYKRQILVSLSCLMIRMDSFFVFGTLTSRTICVGSAEGSM